MTHRSSTDVAILCLGLAVRGQADTLAYHFFAFQLIALIIRSAPIDKDSLV